MRFSRVLSILTTIGVLVMGAHGTVSAASAQANLPINATVAANCTITTTAVTFATAYDPVVTNLTAPDDGTGTIVALCTKGAGSSILLSTGANVLTGQPRMKGPGANDYLNYWLYSNAGRTTVWSGVTFAITASTTSKTAQTFTVYARIPGAQDVSVGAYTDTVQVTLNY